MASAISSACVFLMVLLQTNVKTHLFPLLAAVLVIVVAGQLVCSVPLQILYGLGNLVGLQFLELQGCWRLLSCSSSW